MMPLALFRSRTFAGANLLTLLLYAALGGALFFLPFNLIQVQGYSATAAGAALLPFVAAHVRAVALGRRAGGPLSARALPLIVGPAIAAAGFALFARPGRRRQLLDDVLPGLLVLGLGMAISRRAAHHDGDGRGGGAPRRASPRASTTPSRAPPGCWRSPC